MEFIKHFIANLDKIFTINFTLLAFIITALTILMVIKKGVIEEFKQANLMKNVNEKFKKALNYNLFSGIVALIGFYLNINNQIYQIIITILVLYLFVKSIYWTYKTYTWIIFFIDHQK
jgi:phage shock protein PspC (stress-responsive transcriptional regulator)